MKLSSIIAKEIRLKHLNEGIIHTQTRNRYRNYKLKQHYQTPTACPNQLVMYSNVQGNHFNFRKEHLDAANFSHPSEAYFQIVQLQKEINQAMHALWLKGKSYSKKECLPNNRKILIWSFIGIWTISLLLCIALRLSDRMAGEEALVEWAIMATIGMVIVANIVAFVKAIYSKYRLFEYDKEAIRAVAKILIDSEESLRRCGLEAICDREITWICLRSLDHEYQSQQQMHPQPSEE